VDRVFLDANVLFSAAYREKPGLLRLWQRPETRLITSVFAVEEALVNLPMTEQRQRLKRLLRSISIVPEAPATGLPFGITLPEKDRPILLAAISSQATHLLTGDTTHFGSLFGRRVRGVIILPPARYLAGKL
jgi:predicted nucleic acid-binding protein